LLMASLLSLPLGILSDRLGRKRLASFGLLVLSATSFLLCFGKTPLQLVWIYLFFGMGLAAFGPTMMSLVADISPITHLGRSYGWYTMALYTSMTLGPAIGGFVAREWGFIRVFLYAGILVFIIFWLLLFLLPGERVLPVRQSSEKNHVAHTRELLHNRPLLGCWLVTVGGCFGLGMFVTFIPLHGHNQGLDVGQIGLIFAVQGLFNAVSRIPFGHLSDRVAKRAFLVVIGLLGFAGSMVGFAFSSSLSHFLLVAVVFGLSMGLAFTSIGALIAEVVPPESRGLAMGGYNSCIYFGMMLSSALMGSVIVLIGFKGGFLITASLFSHFMKDFTPERHEAIAE
ncbi:MAG: MFS transporter, partial [Deltaproteobacteria bacterium]|nr:MFS transporter [Deltaproteobacteria bacterium]